MNIDDREKALLQRVAAHVPDPEYPSLSQKPNLNSSEFDDADDLERKGLMRTSYGIDYDRSAELTPQGIDVLRKLAEEEKNSCDWM